MPSSRGPKPDPLSREVDRLLAGLSTLGAQSSHDDRPPSRPASPARVTSRATPRPAPPAGATRGDRAALWARLALGIVFGGLMTQWPYRHECGLPLLGYLGAVAMVMVAGTWIATASWSRRHALIHVLALLVLLWGMTLMAQQVLPRIGYAAERWAWGC